MSIKRLFVAATMAVAVSQAQANVLENGSFEAPNLGGGWNVYHSIPGWVTTGGSGIEIETNGTVVNAQDGDQYVELDSYSNSAMSQAVDTVVGQFYELSFWYRPRTDGGNNDNGINVYWDGMASNSLVGFGPSSEVLNLENYIASQMGDWTEFRVTLQAFSEWTALSFEADGENNSLGGFIDNVSLVRTASVPEPTTLALLGLGMLGLRAARRRA